MVKKEKTRKQRKSKISVDLKTRFSNNQRFFVNKEISEKFPVSQKSQSDFLGSQKSSISKRLTIALVGNPNVGKSVLFNALVPGARQHVGNWPGKTVEKKEGHFDYKRHRIKVVDLPGTYSLTAYSIEELIARNFIVEEKPDIVVHIVDATNLERNLYLTIQLIELGATIILVLNMMDLAEKEGLKIDAKRVSHLLGIPVIKMIATKKIGINKLLDEIIKR